MEAMPLVGMAGRVESPGVYETRGVEPALSHFWRRGRPTETSGARGEPVKRIGGKIIVSPSLPTPIPNDERHHRIFQRPPQRPPRRPVARCAHYAPLSE